MTRTSIVRSARALILLTAVVLALLGTAGPAVAGAPGVGDTGTGTEDLSLQFTSAGHVLLFEDSGVMIASTTHMVQTEFLGANAVVPVASAANTVAAVTGAAAPLGRVTYAGLWDGVDVVYEASDGTIAKSTYYLEDGALVDAIRLGYNRPVSLDDDGNLLVAFETGTMVESAPVAWQEIDGDRRPVAAAYALHSEREVGLVLGDFVSDIPVVIDPSLTWNTFLGSSSYDQGYAIAVDGDGNVYVAGDSYATWGSPQQAHSGEYDAFAAKLAADGTLTWNTFLGGSSDDSGRAIAVDRDGNVYVGGESYATWGSPQQAHSGEYDAFAARLAADGTLTWNTFLGGSSNDSGRAIAVHGDGSVYVGGYSYATWGSPQQAYADNVDAFAAKLAADGTLTWNTFLGGSSADYGYAIAVDGNGNVYVAGESNATWGSPKQPHAGDCDAFAAKLDSDDGALTWNTFLGSSSDDSGRAIAVDGDGNVYVGGDSNATWGSPRQAHAGDYDAFAARLAADGTLTWNTFLGGSSSDYGRAIAVGGDGNVYVGGESNANWGSPRQAHAGDYDAFAARLDSGTALHLDLKTGWNMVSVPVVPADTSRAAVFPPADVVAVYTWNPGTKSYEVPTNIAPEVGYWVAVTEPKTITVTGTPKTTWTSSLTTGWNMVGSVYGDPVAVGALVDDPSGSILDSAIYWWNPVSKSYETATSIVEGQGYWAATTQNCDLTMTA